MYDILLKKAKGQVYIICVWVSTLKRENTCVSHAFVKFERCGDLHATSCSSSSLALQAGIETTFSSGLYG